MGFAQKGMIMKEGLGDILGKTISAVVVAENNRQPRHQVFLVFSDDTQLELYGEAFTCSGSLDRGGVPRAESYAKKLGARITEIYSEP